MSFVPTSLGGVGPRWCSLRGVVCPCARVVVSVLASLLARWSRHWPARAVVSRWGCRQSVGVVVYSLVTAGGCPYVLPASSGPSGLSSCCPGWSLGVCRVVRGFVVLSGLVIGRSGAGHWAFGLGIRRVVRGFVVSSGGSSCRPHVCHVVSFPVLVVWTHWRSSALVTWHLHPVRCVVVSSGGWVVFGYSPGYPFVVIAGKGGQRLTTGGGSRWAAVDDGRWFAMGGGGWRRVVALGYEWRLVTVVVSDRGGGGGWRKSW
jgi:hypothetical protein